jgi:hypothetical protein
LELGAARVSAIYLRAFEIEQAVRKLYSKNGFTVLSQVRNGTGFSKSPRTADMLAVSTWPSRGLYVEGFEIKSSAGDLRRELALPEKADDIARYCAYWWLAVPEGLTDNEMIPPNWGVISVDAKLKATVVTKATRMTPIPMDDLFVCSTLRNFAEGYTPLSEVQPLIERARKEERESAESMRNYRLKSLEEGFATFKEHSGIDLIERNGHPVWDLGSIADAVRLIVALKGRPVAEIMRAKQALTAGVEAINAALGILDDSPKMEAQKSGE